MNYRHGLKNTRFYRIWENLNKRCGNTNYPRFKDYGGRGIVNNWESFIEFRDDMYESYNSHIKLLGEKNTQIERIDNNLGYSKENCRWATAKEQSENRRSNRIITYNGQSAILKEWARRSGIVYQTLWNRVVLYGWPIEKALTQNVR